MFYYNIFNRLLANEVINIAQITLKNRDEVKKLIKLSLLAGKVMLQNGAETYRVEDTMERICSSRENVYNIQTFVTQTGIFLSLEYKGEMFSYFNRIKTTNINLDKIHLINNFSRRFVQTNISLDEGIEIIQEIDTKDSYKKSLKIFSGSSSAMFFCMLFGGNFRDAISSFLLSILVLMILNEFSKMKLSFFINNFVGAFLVSLFAHFCIKQGLGDNLDKIIIGSIMYLVPGVAITNAIRDTMSGDYLAGISRGMEAIFSAISIAFGVGIVLNLI